MSTIPTIHPASGQLAQAGPNDFRDVDIDHFLQLLIVELRNQDPLEPMKNSELLQQIGQIRQISATNVLTETLQSLALSQNLSTASNLIGKQVRALSDGSEEVVGVVERVSLASGDEQTQQRTLRVHVGPHAINLKNVREIGGVELGSTETLDLMDLLNMFGPAASGPSDTGTES